MIKQLRIDDRLVHGEIVALWIPRLGVDTVVVANDTYANNPMLSMTLTLAKPRGCDMPVLTVDNAIAFLNDPAHEREKILVVCNCLQDAEKLVSACEEIKEVNVGAVRSAPGKKQVDLKVFLDEDDIRIIQELEAKGRTIYQQTKPDMKQRSASDVVAKWSKG